VATLEADWTIVPRNQPNPQRKYATAGPVATDQDVVALMQTQLTQLPTR
jgi:hypothetical protein